MLERLRITFRDVKPAGAGWSARCPAHDDKRSSLSIGTGDDGRTLLKCHAGCELQAILTAANLTASDLFPVKDATRARIVAEYPYHDEGGLHLFDVIRFAPKDFRQRRADGAWSMQGVRRVLYRLQDLQGKTIAYLCEGEKDADRLRALGLTATTNPAGAGKWRPEYTAQLTAASIEHVVILPDNDGPGRQHAADVALSCQAAGLKVKIAELPGLPPKGDVTDWLEAGHTKADLVALVKATALAVPTARSEGIAADTIDLVTLADVEPEAITWIWPGRLALGKYTLLAGDPGLGKSTVQLAIAAHLSRGTAWPDGTTAPQGKTLILSAEDGIADTIRPRLDRLHGDASQVVVLRAVRDASGTRPLNLARDLDRLADAIARVKPLVVGIDPITAYLGKTDSYKDAEMRGLLAPLLALLEQERVALLAVGHLSKSDQRAALHRPGGSIAFVAAARIALCLAADPNDADRRVLAGLKSNLGPLPASLAFRLPEGRLEWEAGPALDLDAETLLRPHTPKDRDEDTDAEHVLRELLADTSAWPLEALHAIEAGKAHGISERTMQRTAKRLGVRIRRLGFGRGGKWTWHYPLIDDIPDSRLPISVPVSPMAPMGNQAVIDDTTHIDDTTTFTREEHDERL